MISFKNDYNTLMAPKILEALIKYNDEENVGYGEDYHTQNVSKYVNKLCNKEVDTYILTGGTQTNMVGLLQILQLPYNAVIAVESGHINVHETGAIESTGHKVLTTKGKNGKVLPNEVEEIVNLHTDHHMVKPKAVYISNSTEIGTIYKKEELIELYKTCKKLGLYLFMDGARLGVALASKENDLTIEDIATYTDMFYIGGTKLGCPIGECLVVVNDELKKDIKYLIKNKGALLAKGFFAGICFEEFFKDNYFLELASRANELAELLRTELIDDIVYPNSTNQVFLSLPNSMMEELSKDYLFETWEAYSFYSIVRIVTTFHSSKVNVEKFIKDVKNIEKLSQLS